MVALCLYRWTRSSRVELTLDLAGVHLVDARQLVNYLLADAAEQSDGSDGSVDAGGSGVCPITIDTGLAASSQFGLELSQLVPKWIAEKNLKHVEIRRGLFQICNCGKHSASKSLN